MANPSSHRIALIFAVEDEYASRLMAGAIDYAQAHPEIKVVEIPYTRLGPNPVQNPPFKFDAAVTFLALADTWVLELLDAGIDVVNTSGDWWNEVPSSVTFDGRLNRDLIFKHLLGLGRTNLAYIGEATSGSPTLIAQQAYFADLMRQAEVEPLVYEIGRVAEIELRLTQLPDEKGKRLQGFLSSLPKPAAVACEDDYVARLVCEEAAKAGIRVPEDLAVVGLGDYAVSRLTSPPITTLPQPGEVIGHVAMEFAHKILEGTEKPGKRMAPSPPLVIRESTGGGMLADEQFATIRKLIHDQACEGLQVGELVDMLPMSQFTFSKHFQRLYGRTPGEEIRHVKIEQAKRHLRSTNSSIERIATLCGFEQQGKFSKFFKRETGMTPTEYRRGGGE